MKMSLSVCISIQIHSLETNIVKYYLKGIKRATAEPKSNMESK